MFELHIHSDNELYSAINILETDEKVEVFKLLGDTFSFDNVLDDWPRLSGKTFYENPDDATGADTLAWQYDTTANTFFQGRNTSTNEMLLSPYFVEDDYEFTVELTSTSADDDGIGQVIGFQNTPTGVRFLVAWFHTGGWGGDASDPRQFKIRVNAVRTGDNLRIMHSDFNDPDVLLPASEMNISFSTLPRQGNLLATNTRFGFGTNSQPLSYFIDYSMMSASSIDESIIYSYESDNKWVYDDTTNNWTLEGNQINTDFDSSQVIKSINTNVDYKNDSGSLTILMDSGIDDIVVDYSAPANSSYAINTDTLVDKYNFPEPLKVTAVASIQNLNTVSLNTGSITMYTEGTNGSFIVRLESETSNIFDYRKIRLNIT